MRVFLNCLFCLLSSSLINTLPSSAHAEPLTLERILASPALSGPAVRKLKISPDGSRVTFLRPRDDDRQQLDLWEFNVAEKTTRRLIDSRRLQPEEQLSAEEQARRERARTGGLRGILDYSWSPDSKQILVPLAGSLYRVEVAHPDQAHKLLSGEFTDAKISPRGRYVSFVQKQNLFVIDLQKGKTGGPARQLTRDGGGTIHNAEAEFVAQEEMAQHTGYWWAPDDSALAFKRFDEAPVSIARRVQIHAERTELAEQRYPYAGNANVLVGLGLVSPTGGRVRMIDLGPEKDIYLARVNWRADAKEVWYQRQSRDQKTLDLIAVKADTLTQRTVLTETASTWVDLHEDLRFLKKQDAFIWASERSGRKHLYLYQLNGRLLHPLSAGDWGIDQVLAVDEATGKVLVASNKDHATEKQVYALPLSPVTGKDDMTSAVQRITQADGWHEAVFSADGKVFVDHFSSPTTPPQVSLRASDNTLLTWLERNELNQQHPYAPYLDRHVTPEFGTLQAEDGQIMHYSLLKPAGFDPQRRYPVFVNVYGGPVVQTVTRRWQGGDFDQYMAQQGYVVFRLDNRGSSRRERRFTDVIYHNLGQHEVADQLRGIAWLSEQSFVDARKIAVFGGSYGGFMTLRMLAAAPDKIAAGVAHASPIDWRLYDTHYTERFLGRPQEDEKVYSQSGVLPYLKTLRSPLLVTHGMADDNVLFSNATSLMQALNQQGALYELLTYPSERHGIRAPANRLHWYRSIESFLARRLN